MSEAQYFFLPSSLLCVVIMAKSFSDLRKMQRNQLSRLTKEDLIEGILSAPGTSDEHLVELTNKLHTLVGEVAELRNDCIRIRGE